MNNNKQFSDETQGVAIAFTFVALAALAMVGLYAIFAFIMGIVCLFALFKPLRLGKYTIYPSEAREYWLRGITGTVMTLFAAVFINSSIYRIEAAWVPYILVMGFALSSLGVQQLRQSLGILCPEEKAELAAKAEASMPKPAPAAPKAEAPKSYAFADWDDDDTDPYK